MFVGITDLPLEVAEVALIVGLSAGLYMQHRALKRDKESSDRQLSAATEELKHLRRMLDKILLVEKGYARPSEEIDEDEEARRKRNPTLL